MYKALSTGLLGFPGRSVQDDIPLAVKYSYKGLMIDVKAAKAAYAPSELAGILEKNKLIPAAFGLPLDFRKDRETFESGLKNLAAFCEYAKSINMTRCNTWIMPCSDTLDYKSNFELHRERLTAAAKIMEGYGIRLGLEFVGPKTLRQGKAFEFIHDLAGLDELLDAIGTHNVGYLMDVFHWDTAGQKFGDFKKITNEKVVVVHINDGVKGIPLDEQLDGKRELPGATGVLRINEFMKGLQEIKYDGPVMVEPFSAALKAMPVEDAVKATKAATDKVWPE
ncbi:MAG: sugar phosphate isomerase/epimerase [Treponema sp.]|nr:sugar phosphate isomerase/epimerase [Treponema sp.]